MAHIHRPLAFAVLVFFVSAPAFAQEIDDPGDTGESSPARMESASSARFGVGVETVLTAPFAPTVVAPFTPAGAAAVSYDAGPFRIDGLMYILFIEDVATTFALGGRFFYVLHRGRSADIALGAGLALGFIDGRVGDAQLRVAMEGAGQIRAFITPTVALTASAGLGFSLGEGSFVFGIGGQLTGAFGIMYYF